MPHVPFMVSGSGLVFGPCVGDLEKHFDLTRFQANAICEDGQHRGVSLFDSVNVLGIPLVAISPLGVEVLARWEPGMPPVPGVHYRLPDPPPDLNGGGSAPPGGEPGDKDGDLSGVAPCEGICEDGWEWSSSECRCLPVEKDKPVIEPTATNGEDGPGSGGGPLPAFNIDFSAVPQSVWIVGGIFLAGMFFRK